VVEAAARIADAHGSDAVTLASVAAALGIRSPSLYAHVDGLDGLRRRLALHAAAAMAEALGTAAAGRLGLDALEAIAHAYRAFARQHPGRYAAAQRAVPPGQDDELYRALAAAAMPAIQAMHDAGVTGEDAIHLTRAFRAALHGFVSLEQIGGFGMPTAVDESFSRFVALLLAGARDAVARRPLPPPD
jgi:AcrR family transcriptional regulator